MEMEKNGLTSSNLVERKERFGDQNRLIDHDAASFYEFDSKKQEALNERVMSSQNDEPVLFSCGVCYGIKKKCELY